MTLHTCKPTNGFFAFTHEKKRNEIAHLGDHKWFIHICEKKKRLVNKKQKNKIKKSLIFKNPC